MTIPATKVRKNFFKLVEQAAKPGNAIIITVEGDAKVVMMSQEDYEGWIETLEIMSDENLVKGIKEGIEDIKKGRVYTQEEFNKRHNV